MPDVMDAFPHLEALSIPELHQRYAALKGSGPAGELGDDVLRELVCIARVLRKRSSGPPKAKAEKATKAGPPTLDLL